MAAVNMSGKAASVTAEGEEEVLPPGHEDDPGPSPLSDHPVPLTAREDESKPLFAPEVQQPVILAISDPGPEPIISDTAEVTNAESGGNLFTTRPLPGPPQASVKGLMKSPVGILSIQGLTCQCLVDIPSKCLFGDSLKKLEQERILIS